MSKTISYFGVFRSRTRTNCLRYGQSVYSCVLSPTLTSQHFSATRNTNIYPGFSKACWRPSKLGERKRIEHTLKLVTWPSHAAEVQLWLMKQTFGRPMSQVTRRQNFEWNLSSSLIYVVLNVFKPICKIFLHVSENKNMILKVLAVVLVTAVRSHA